MDRLIEAHQIRIFHGILAGMGKINDKEFKADLVKQYSNMRVSSTKGLYYAEAERLIDDLNKAVKKGDNSEAIAKESRLRLFFYYCHLLQWYVSGQPSERSDKPKLDYRHIDDWCIKYGRYHKRLSRHSAAELSHLLVQIEKVYNGHLNSG